MNKKAVMRPFFSELGDGVMASVRRHAITSRQAQRGSYAKVIVRHNARDTNCRSSTGYMATGRGVPGALTASPRSPPAVAGNQELPLQGRHR
ncbi:hypothetical protein GPK29_22555 [Aeromonas hydrophila]|uniref:hypothetical protein n=1 Tax=Aeromonas hydrophila TaxID=644 RepID=UPI001C5AA961|nr:hypothetical protein [Aeromonas hydrophila]MBW3798978.1 hypothetical protein [Aeromonas hydrophila]MBW3803771.1 hypothetical protein [Aeromonas hydrophila]MBW3821766.1 hypothetical protein [Aeromonas hydrophila]